VTSKTMDENTEIWQQYYEKALSRSHLPRTEFAVKLNASGLNIAIDCGCGTGSDIAFLDQQGYQVHGFDINPDSISICRDRFGNNPLIDISLASFEHFDYPQAGVITANSSLFFADPNLFDNTWQSMISSLQPDGVFAGDFMGVNDSWASGYRSPTAPLTKQQVVNLFENFDIIRFHERDERGQTALGKTKQWHIFSVVAIKRT